jgi:hypothetical protein
MFESQGMTKVSEENGVTVYQDPRTGIKLRYDANAKHDLFSGQGDDAPLECFGDRLANPQYVDVAGMREKMTQFHTFSEAPIVFQRTGEVSDTHKEIYDDVTGEFVNVLTKDYRILQNKDLFGKFADICESMNLSPIGNFKMLDHGFTVNENVFMDKDMTFNILEQYDEPCAFMLDMRNSFDGRMGAYIGGGVLQGICSNRNFWGKRAESVWIPHDSKEIDKVPAILESYMANIANMVPSMVRKYSDAEGTEVYADELVDILWGTTIPQCMIDAIASNPQQFNSRLPERDLSMFQVFNCVTNGLTFYQTRSYRSVLSHFDSAMKLLTTKKDRIIDDGEARRQKYADQLAKAQIKRDEQKKQTVRVLTNA